MHNKNSKNNLMNKIKTYFTNTYIIKLIKEYSINKNICLKKLRRSFTNNLNKSINQNLLEKK